MTSRKLDRNISKGRREVELVSVSFKGRDLSLAVVGLKSYAMKDKNVAETTNIRIAQFDIDDSEDRMFDELNSRNTTLFCFSTYVWNFNKILNVAKRLKESKKDAKVLFGGPQASGMAEKLLKKYEFVDYVIKGEGELAFKEFLLTDDLTKVPNLFYRSESTVVSNRFKSVGTLNELALPFESEEYRKYLDESKEPVRAAIETSRGCPFSCGYCGWGTKEMRYFDLDKLKPVFEYLLNHPNVATVYITDSNPFLKKDRARELLNFLLEKNVNKKPITFELNPEYMSDNELLESITKVNEEEFAFGVQSTSPEVLGKIGRKFDSDLYRKNIQLMKKFNPKVKMWFSLIIGLPGDNYKQFLESMDFVLNLKPEGIYAHELLCLPGSQFYQKPEHYGIEFSEEPPHKLVSNRTFPLNEYNLAKHLSYHISLFHRIKWLVDELHKLSEQQNKMRLVDIFEAFVRFLDGKLDALCKEKIEDVSSWFFEKYAKNFMEDEKNLTKLRLLYGAFKEEFTRAESLNLAEEYERNQSFVESLGSPRVFVHEINTLPGFEQIVSQVEGIESYDRVSAIARPEDVVILKTHPDIDYLNWLSDVGLGTKNIIVLEGDKVLPSRIIDSMDKQRLKAFFKDRFDSVVFSPYYGGHKEYSASRHLGIDMYAKAHLVERFDSKINFKNLCREEGVPVVDDVIFSVAGGTEKLSSLVSSALKKTGKAVVRGEFGASASTTIIFDKLDPGLIDKVVSNASKNVLYIIEPYYNKRSSPSSVWFLCKNGKIVHLRTSNQKLEGGISHAGNEFPCEFDETAIEKYSYKIAKRLSKEGFIGPVGMDFIETDEGFFATECNPRVTGAMYPWEIVNILEKRHGRINAARAENIHIPKKGMRFKELMELWKEYLYDGNKNTGAVIPFNVGPIDVGKVSVVGIGSSKEEVDKLFIEIKNKLSVFVLAASPQTCELEANHNATFA